MDVKLVAVRHSGDHRVGQHVTDPGHVEDILSGPLRKRYVRAAVHPGDVPFEPTLIEEPAPQAESAPLVLAAPTEEQVDTGHDEGDHA